MKYVFGDIVVVNGEDIGVVVKCWVGTKGTHYDVYVRNTNDIEDFDEDVIKRYLVRHKFLSKKEKEYQFNAENNL